MKTRRFTGFILGGIFVLAALSLLASCGGRSGSGNAAADDGSPTDIAIAFAFDGVEPPQPGDDIWRTIEEYTNTRLSPTWYTNYTAVVYPTLLASGDMPEIVTALDIPITKAAVKDGLFWDLDPFLAETENLSGYHPTIIQNSKVDGKLIGVPKVRPLVRRTILYRGDWAEKLGIKHPPTNIPELYEMFRAFAHDDPDGNGIKDTYGLTTQTGQGIQFFTFLFGAPNIWEVGPNGEFINHFTTPEYIEGLKFLKRLYDEKILHPEWATVNRNQFNIMFTEGMVLGAFLDSTNAFQQLGAPLEEKVPDAWIGSVTHMTNPRGEVRTFGESGHLGWLAIPKTVPEAKAKKVVKFLDMMSDETMCSLMIWGKENVHHRMVNGMAVMIPEMESRYVDSIRWPWRLPLSTVDYEYIAKPGVYSKYAQMQLDVDQEELKYMVPNPSYPLFSQTLTERNQNLEQILNDAGVQFINGMITEAQFKDEVEKWKVQGGDLVARELAADYAAMMK